jgi:hypothetical protein
MGCVWKQTVSAPINLKSVRLHGREWPSHSLTVRMSLCCVRGVCMVFHACSGGAVVLYATCSIVVHHDTTGTHVKNHTGGAAHTVAYEQFNRYYAHNYSFKRINVLHPFKTTYPCHTCKIFSLKCRSPSGDGQYRTKRKDFINIKIHVWRRVRMLTP